MPKQIPFYVLNPRSKEKGYIPITEIEPGSELAHAVVRAEQLSQASGDRLREIADYLAVDLLPPTNL